MKKERLNTILNYISENDKLADIGCDHGYLGILALKKGLKFIQLIDNKKGPLDSAKENLAFYLQHLDNQNVIFTLSSGLNDLDIAIDTVSICGLGGILAINIINDNLSRAKRLNKIIFQVNSDIYKLRSFLNENNFAIIAEDIVYDYKYYEIIVAKYQEDISKLTEIDLKFGPILRKSCKNEFINKWNLKYQENLKTLHNIKEKPKNSHNQNIMTKVIELEQENKQIEDFILKVNNDKSNY